MDNLEEQIQERIQQAQDREIAVKAVIIAKYLGHMVLDYGYLEYKFNNLKLRIEASDRRDEGGVRIIIPGSLFRSPKEVFHANYYCSRSWNIYSYIPGPWENKLDYLYNKAFKRYEAYLEKRQEAKEQEHRERAKRFDL